MITFSGNIEKFEDAESIGNRIIIIRSKKDNIELKIELPEKILFFNGETKDEINIMISNDEIKKEDLKILIEGSVYSVEEKDELTTILVSMGGLPVRLRLKSPQKEFKPRSKFVIGMY